MDKVYCKNCKWMVERGIHNIDFMVMKGYACYGTGNLSPIGYILPEPCLDKNADFHCKDYAEIKEEVLEEEKTSWLFKIIKRIYDKYGFNW